MFSEGGKVIKLRKEGYLTIPTTGCDDEKGITMRILNTGQALEPGRAGKAEPLRNMEMHIKY